MTIPVLGDRGFFVFQMENFTMSFLIDGMVGELNRQLLRYAVGRAISCPGCKTILDERSTVLVTVGKTSVVQCGECHDETVHKLDTRGVSLLADDVIDGRASR